MKFIWHFQGCIFIFVTNHNSGRALILQAGQLASLSYSPSDSLVLGAL